MGLIFAAASFATAETLMEENFDNFAESKNLKYFKIKPSNASELSGENALEGNASLRINTLAEKTEYPTSLCIESPELSGGAVYKLSFKYKILAAPKNSNKPVNFVYMASPDCASPQDRIPVFGGVYNSPTFAGETGETKEMEVKFISVNSQDKNLRIYLTSHFGIDIAVDGLKIEKLPLPQNCWMFEKSAFPFLRVPPTNGNFLLSTPEIQNMTKEEFFPFVDKYGQFKHKKWKNKIGQDSDLKSRLEEENEFNKKHQAIKNRDKYFGLVNPDYKYEATGRFRTQKVNGKWFFVTPEGNLFWSHGVDCAGATASTPTTMLENYFDDISDKRYAETGWTGRRSKFFFKSGKFKTFNFPKRNIDIKYKDGFEGYLNACLDRMSIWGLNTFGAWTSPKLVEKQKVPYAFFVKSNCPTKLNSKLELTEYWQPMSDFFDPAFEDITRNIIAKSAEQIKSPYCLGVFIDNELPWQNRPLLTPKAILSCPKEQFAKIEFREMMKKKYGDIANLNKQWNSKYADWEDFLSRRDFYPKTKKGEADMLRIERKFNSRYFEVCKKLLKEISPDTLYLGCRLAWTNKITEEVAAKYCDVVSYNLYREDVADFKMPEKAADKPVIVGEFHFGNQDRGVFGGGLKPSKDMAERVKRYETYVMSALENPIIVGAHWFQWIDQPITGRSGDGENYSVGFIDIADTPQYEMAEKAREMAEKMYDVRLSGKRTVKIQKHKTVTY